MMNNDTFATILCWTITGGILIGAVVFFVGFLTA